MDKALLAKTRALDQEIMFLRQLGQAQRVQAALELPREAPMPLLHSHACAHCDTTWSCECEEGSKHDYWRSKRHGCPEQLAYSRRMAILMSMADRPTGGRTARPTKLEAKAKKLEAELTKLQKELGQ